MNSYSDVHLHGYRNAAELGCVFTVPSGRDRLTVFSARNSHDSAHRTTGSRAGQEWVEMRRVWLHSGLTDIYNVFRSHDLGKATFELWREPFSFIFQRAP